MTWTTTNHWLTGRTEEIKNNSDPSFKTKFVVNFSFEEQQWVKFEVYDLDKLTKEVSIHQQPSYILKDSKGQARKAFTKLTKKIKLPKIMGSVPSLRNPLEGKMLTLFV